MPKYITENLNFSELRASRMVQWVETLFTKPEAPGSVPMTLMVEGDNGLPTDCPLTSICMPLSKFLPNE